MTIASRDAARGDRQYAARRISVLTRVPGGPRLCKTGFVWREAHPTDVMCVDPSRREEVKRENARAHENRGSNVCIAGFVWREAGPSDHVCVTPEVREQTRRDNAARETGERYLGPICDHYAAEASSQSKEARSRGCQMPGPPERWDVALAGHANWCQTARPHDRRGESGARRKALRDCGSAGNPRIPPGMGEACAVSAVVRNQTCINADGTPSSLAPGGSTSTACGGTEALARARARLGFALTFSCITEEPTSGCCTVQEEVAPGCICQ